MFFWFGYLSGQTPPPISFDYDNAGNRTTRYVFYIKSGEIENNEEEDDPKINQNEEFFKHNLGSREINIYPNPVKSELTMEIMNGEKEEKYRFLLFDIQGKLLRETMQQGNGSQTVNMSDYPRGTYILVINTEREKVEYKIIKE